MIKYPRAVRNQQGVCICKERHSLSFITLRVVLQQSPNRDQFKYDTNWLRHELCFDVTPFITQAISMMIS